MDVHVDGWPDVGRRCQAYIGLGDLLSLYEWEFEEKFDRQWHQSARNVCSIVERSKAFLRKSEVTLTLVGNSVRLTHKKFLLVALATEDGFVVLSGSRSGVHSPHLKLQAGDLDLKRITTVRLLEDAIDAIAQHLARLISEGNTDA